MPVKGQRVGKQNIIKTTKKLVFVFLHTGELLFYTDINFLDKIKKYNWYKASKAKPATYIDGLQCLLSHYLFDDLLDDLIIRQCNHIHYDYRLCNLKAVSK